MYKCDKILSANIIIFLEATCMTCRMHQEGTCITYQDLPVSNAFIKQSQKSQS